LAYGVTLDRDEVARRAIGAGLTRVRFQEFDAGDKLGIGLSYGTLRTAFRIKPEWGTEDVLARVNEWLDGVRRS
jgi:hypothetical protein